MAQNHYLQFTIELVWLVLTRVWNLLSVLRPQKYWELMFKHLETPTQSLHMDHGVVVVCLKDWNEIQMKGSSGTDRQREGCFFFFFK